MKRPAHYLYPALLCLLACALYYTFFINTAFVEVELEVTESTDFKIYWAEKGRLYSEKNMSVVIAHPGRTHYSFFLTDIKNIDRLRIDTHKYTGEAILRHFAIEQEGYGSLTLSGSRGFDKLVPLAQIDSYRVTDDGLWLRSTGEDPNFELLISPQYLGIDSGSLLLRLSLLAFSVLLLCRGTSYLARDLLFVPLFLFGVWVLIIVMAGLSERNVHPDEYVHLQATLYYGDHWLVPAAEDESIRDTYSVYGVSRLNSGEIYYLFAGKFHKLLESFKIQEYLSLRLFNICLFGLILLYTIKNKYARMVAIPFLLSPQIWYLFSYCGSDAFALFISFLVGCELVDPASLLNRFLKVDRGRFLPALLLLGVLLGCLFLLKKNYYPFIAFVYLFLGVRLFFSTSFYAGRKTALKRLAVVTGVGVLIFGFHLAESYVANGLDRNAKIAEMQEKLADPGYKPSKELDERYGTLNVRARGTTLIEMVRVTRWFEKSFRSSFGVFGYFTISASQTYYDLVRWTALGLLAFFLGSIFLRGGLISSGLAFSVVVLSGALIAVSFYQSWTNDYQAQGRYLLPIVPMLGILYAHTCKIINARLLIFGVSAMYLLGMYAFIFQALLGIPKVVLH